MQLPVLSEVAKSRDYRIDFRGYNHNMYVDENQFYDTKNLCATNYPVMSPRAQRATVRTMINPGGLLARNKLCWVDNGRFYWDGVQYGGQLTAGEKQLVGMGAYVLIFPDAVRFNTSTKETDSLNARFSASGTVTITLCRQDGSDYGHVTTAEEAPETAEKGDYWLDTSGETHVLRMYTGDQWISVGTTYVRMEAAGIGNGFAAGDAVEISGAAEESLNGSKLIEKAEDDRLIMIGIIDRTISQSGGLKIERTVPEMDFVCELNNRVWGCSSEKREIYACKLGDATNWRAYSGLASDSYTATVGSAGDFTGCVSFGGQVLFFKEEMLHKVMGDKPANFQITAVPLRGVQKGSEKSLCVVNESLMYKSIESVVVYDGGAPMDVSDALGTGMFYDAAAGVQGDRYYISMRGEDGAWNLFVFDEAKGIWFREDDTQARVFAQLRGQLYYIDSQNRMVAVRGLYEPGATVEGAFDWYAETGDILMNLPDNKYVSRVQIRAGVEKGATLKLEMQYDSSGEWVTIFERGYSRKASFTVPIVPARCDHFRMRISGHGRSCVYAIGKELEMGSEI